MAEVKCPQCGSIISLEQSDLDAIVHQVRDEEFEREIAERTRIFEAQQKQAVELAASQAKAEFANREKELEMAAAEAKNLLTSREKELEMAAAKAQAEYSAELDRLRSELESKDELAKTSQQLAVAQAVSEVEKERDSLSAALELQKSESERAEATLKAQMAEQLKAKDGMIAYQQEEIERIRDMKARLTTKLVGESLEQHCQYEFDRIRATAFPNAYFEKDNTVVEGTKGDYVFRELDEEGNEIISIMFEMKNEEEGGTTHKKNEDHLAKLDKDRNKKNCEYAVLVSLLEPENELYNEGIVDVSHKHPKMYVIRPQFFIALISLLRNAALSGLKYKQELALMRRQEMDITNFEHDLETFKEGFFKNFGDASLRFDDAINAIDKAIADLEKAKQKLQVSNKHLTAANNKLEGLTVKKLVRKNPTMKAKFEALNSGEES